MNNTKIEWCDSTWNSVTGCLHDCEYCYARKIANRFGTIDKTIESAAEEGIGLGDAYFRNPDYFYELNEPVRNENGRIEPYPANFYPTFHRYRLNEPQKWKKPCTIFVCSMADLFGEWVPDEWIKEVFEACAKAQQHRYLFLTKNPKRYVELERRFLLPHNDNMWYGTTATNNEQFSNAVKSFGNLSSKAKTFLSIEPLLENIDAVGVRTPNKGCNALAFMFYWVIIGAETGNNKNKIVPEKSWIDSICNAADEVEIPVFMKESLLPIMGEENMRREFPWQNEV